MALNNVYQVKMKCEQAPQKTLNVFYYQHTVATTTDASDLASLFNTFVWINLRPIISSSVVLRRIEVTNLANPTDYHILTGSQAGSRSANFNMFQDAWSFTIVRARTDHKSGGKRIPGVADVDVNNHVQTTPMDSLLATAAAAMESPLVLAGGDTWRPRIKATRYGDVFATYNPVSSVEFFMPSTQNSRKPYTGPGW